MFVGIAGIVVNGDPLLGFTFIISVNIVVDGQPPCWAFIINNVDIVVNGQPPCWTYYKLASILSLTASLRAGLIIS